MSPSVRRHAVAASRAAAWGPVALPPVVSWLAVAMEFTSPGRLLSATDCILGAARCGVTDSPGLDNPLPLALPSSEPFSAGMPDRTRTFFLLS